MLETIQNYQFMQNAIIAALFASIMSGFIGSIIIEKKMVGMSGGLAHASFGGIGLGYLLGFEPIWGGMIFSTIASFTVKNISKKDQIQSEVLVGILWSLGMALGILFINLSPDYMPDMTSYLFGDILTVSRKSLIYMGIFTLIATTIIITLFPYIEAYLFDTEHFKAKGINTNLLENLIYILIPLGIIVLVKVVGIILAIAMLTIPTAIAKLYANSLKRVITSATIFSIIFCLLGITISYYLNIPSGVCIILLSSAIYFIARIITKIVVKSKHKKSHQA